MPPREAYDEDLIDLERGQLGPIHARPNPAPADLTERRRLRENQLASNRGRLNTPKYLLLLDVLDDDQKRLDPSLCVCI